MRTLFTLLWTDQVGSVLSAEMALVTAVTVGALFMGMAEFSATVNREFQNSAREDGLAGTEEPAQEEDTVVRKKKSEAEKTEDEKAEDEEKRNQWQFRRAEDRETPENRD
jgi:3-hydroxyisobutyrate dehydrogenase-like beta-hydroxyacid dehydrogenase